MLHTLNFHLRDDFAVPHVAVPLWRHPEGREELPGSPGADQQLQAFAETLTQPYCGSTSDETSSWFGEAATHVRSQGLIAMRNGGGTMGMIALGSKSRTFLRRNGHDPPRAARRDGFGSPRARSRLRSRRVSGETPSGLPGACRAACGVCAPARTVFALCRIDPPDI